MASFRGLRQFPVAASPRAPPEPRLGTAPACRRGHGGAHQRNPIVERQLARDQSPECARDGRLHIRMLQRAREQRHRLQRLDRLADRARGSPRRARPRPTARRRGGCGCRARGRWPPGRPPRPVRSSTPAARRAHRRSARPRRRCVRRPLPRRSDPAPRWPPPPAPRRSWRRPPARRRAGRWTARRRPPRA